MNIASTSQLSDKTLFLVGASVVLAGLLLTSCSDGISPQSTSTNPTSTTSPIGTTATFNFDDGASIVLGQSTPFEFSIGEIRASFSSPIDPGAFSIQNQATTAFYLPLFSGNYLYANSATRTYLEIRFDQLVKSVSFTFATTDAQGAANIENPSYLKASAFLNSSTSPPVVIVSNRGAFTGSTFPQGVITLLSSANSAFDLIRLELIPQPQGGSAFLVDNIIIAT